MRSQILGLTLFILVFSNYSFAITRSCSFKLEVRDASRGEVFFVDQATTAKATRTRGGDSTARRWRERAKRDATNAATLCLYQYAVGMTLGKTTLPVSCHSDRIDTRPYRMPDEFYSYLSQEVCMNPTMHGRSQTQVNIVLSANQDDGECVGSDAPYQRDGGILVHGFQVYCQ